MKADTSQSMTPEFERSEVETIVDLWLVLERAAASGDREARAFLSGTFGPWSSEMIRNHAS